MTLNREPIEPTVSVEGGESAGSERTWRVATIAVIVLTVFVCLCFAGVLLLNPFQSLGQGASANASPTRRSGGFAATWTPTPTDTATPTAPPRPSATPTRTATATATATPPSTPSNTPRPPTNTPRPRPTNTRRPPATATRTPVPQPTATHTPAYQFSVGFPTSTVNCGSMGVFGTVRDRNGNLKGGVKVLVAAGSSAFVANSAAVYLNAAGDRNFEVSSTANGLAAGTYAVYAATASGGGYTPISASANVKVTGLGDDCGTDGHRTQWWKVDFKEN